MGGEEGGTGHRTSANKSFYVDPGSRLNELTEGTVTIDVGSLFQSLTTCTEKHVFLRRRRLELFMLRHSELIEILVYYGGSTHVNAVFVRGPFSHVYCRPKILAETFPSN